MFEIVKIVHIVAIISWMAALLYLPRLFVYHADKSPESEIYSTFLTMERKLIQYIMNPAMILSIASGIALIVIMQWYREIWLHVKILAVCCLLVLHFYYIKMYKNFLANSNKKSHKFFRIVNEIPAILMIIIVALVVLKPYI